MKPGRAFRDRIKFEDDYDNIDIVIRFNNPLFSSLRGRRTKGREGGS